MVRGVSIIGADGVVEMVRMVLPPELVIEDEKEAEAPVGTPETLKLLTGPNITTLSIDKTESR
jgi:hypothetical protein